MYEWATHQPMIRAVMDTWKPKFVLELGVGDYSTPLLMSYGVRMLSVENDPRWISKYDTEIIHHDIHEKDYDDLTDDDRSSIASFYRGIKLPRVKTKLLFVDNWAMCRAIAVNTLKDRFDLIIYHDSELAADHWDTVDTSGFYLWDLKTQMSWTTLMAREKRELNITGHIMRFLEEYKDCTYMNVDTR